MTTPKFVRPLGTRSCTWRAQTQRLRTPRPADDVAATSECVSALLPRCETCANGIAGEGDTSVKNGLHVRTFRAFDVTVVGRCAADAYERGTKRRTVHAPTNPTVAARSAVSARDAAALMGSTPSTDV